MTAPYPWLFNAQRCPWLPALGVGPQRSLSDADPQANALLLGLHLLSYYVGFPPEISLSPAPAPFFSFSRRYRIQAPGPGGWRCWASCSDSGANSNTSLTFSSLQGSSDDLKFCVLYLAEVSPCLWI